MNKEHVQGFIASLVIFVIIEVLFSEYSLAIELSIAFLLLILLVYLKWSMHKLRNGK